MQSLDHLHNFCLKFFFRTLQGYNRPKEYIATQGPLPDTMGDFWRLVWQYDVPTIIMLTNLVEKDTVRNKDREERDQREGERSEMMK